MNVLLLFFALPIATIILSIVLEKILRCPILTAATFFAIYLIVTFAAFDASFLVFAIAYTILSFIAAYLAELFFDRCDRRRYEERRRRNSCCQACCPCCPPTSNGINPTNVLANTNVNGGNNCGCECNQNNVATVNVADRFGRNGSTWCCYRKNNANR